MKNILICLEKMGIGGVETSVLNQAFEYKKRGFNPIVVAGKGIFSEKLKELNIIQEYIEFPVEDNLNMEKAKLIVKIIEKYNIELVIINQLPCLLSVLPACIIKNIPYIAYVHESLFTIQEDEHNTLNWFENNFEIYKDLLKFYYNNAYKIIAISEDAKKYIKNRYKIDSNKLIVMHNSIDLDKYKSTRDIKEKNNFILISRISESKLQSIKNGIDIFDEYESDSKKLIIVGDGDKLEETKKYANSKNSGDKINFIGQQNDIIKLINENDIVLGLDRVLLEAISMKRIAVNIGYDKPKQIIDSTNIEIEANEGFCGKKLESTEPRELAIQIKNREIDLQKNYNYVKENLSIEKNIFTEKVDKNNYENALLELFQIIKQKEENIKEEKSKELSEYAVQKSQIENLKNELENKQNEINNLKIEYDNTFNELKSVYNSKRFKVVNKIANLYRRKK